MGLELIGSGIKTRLETISSIRRVFAPSELPDSINQFPTALIIPGETTYDTAFDRNSGFTFRILLVFTKQDQPSVLANMLDYIEISGSDSVVAAINGDSTLNSSADDSRIISNKGLGTTVWGGITYLSTEWELQAWV